MNKLIDSAAGTCTCAPPCWEQAKNVLEEEANVLAMWLDATLDTTYPPRVGIAVRREIKRLRDLGAGLAPNNGMSDQSQSKGEPT